MSSTLQLHHCVVDLTGARACWPDRDVSLTDNEVKLLAYLAERRGEDVPRGDLLQHVWGYSPNVRSRAVDQTVKRLRKKLEVNPAEPDSLILVYGIGYRLVLPVADSAERLAVTPGRLPRLPGATHGRQDALAWLQTHASGGAALALAGPPGVGKSHVALAFAAQVRDGEDPVGGVWVVDCDPIDTTAALLAAVRHTLSLDGADTETPEQLAARLDRRGPALVVFDNCDAVAGLGPLVEELAQSSQVRWLVTTRQRLGPYARHFDVEPLPEDDALALFQERAAWVVGGALPTERAVRPLLAALDCNPLAICLAAARSNLLDPAALLKRMAVSPDVLAHPSKAPEDRHGSLERALVSSWALLTDAEQRALVRLTVFTGTFSLEAAEAVVGADALDLLQALCDHSLIEPRHEDGQRVYRLPLLVRSDASRRSPAEHRKAQERLMVFLAELHKQFWTSPSSFAWDSVLPLVRYRADLDWAFRACDSTERTIQLGLALAEVEGYGGKAYARARVMRMLTKRYATPEDPDLALYLGTLAATDSLNVRSPEARREALEALESLVAQCRTMAAPLHWLRALGRQAIPDPSGLVQVADRIRSWLDDCFEPLWEAVGLLFIGRFRGVAGELDVAADCFDHALALCADQNVPLLHAYTFYSRGYAAMEQNQMALADDCFRSACELLEASGDPRSTMLQALLGLVDLQENRLDDAEAHFRAAARYTSAHGAGWAREDELFMGYVAISRGDLEAAEQWFASSVDLSRRWGSGPGVAAPLLAATRVALGTTPERVTHLMDQGPGWSPYTRAARMYADAVAGGASPDPAALDSASLFSTTLARRCLTAWLAQKSVG